MQNLLSAVFPVQGGKAPYLEVAVVLILLFGVLAAGYLVYEHIRDWRTKHLWQRRNEEARRLESEE